MKRNKYAELVADQANVPYSDALKRMRYVRDKYGLSFVYFYKHKLYYQNEIRLAKMLEARDKGKEETRLELAQACQELGIDEATLKQRAKDLSTKVGYPISWKNYYRRRMDLMPYSEIESYARFTREEKFLRTNLKKRLEKLRAKGKDLEVLKPQMEKLKAHLGKILSDDVREEIIDAIRISGYDVDTMDPGKLEELILDIQAMRLVFFNSPVEYFMYDFPEKTLTERGKFLSISEKRKYAERVCDPFDSDYLDSKWHTYLKFKKHYHREAVLVEKEESYDAFVEFCQKHGKCIAKPLSELKGDNIRVYDFGKEDAPTYREAFDDMLSSDIFVVEEFLTQCPELNTFNPDSINTIRLISIHTGDKIELRWSIIRTGRKGSNVDNAGSGGVFAAIDLATGTICTDASDETGRRYDKHPDSGVTFKGFKIPKWEELLAVCTELAKELPTVKYIGWDFCLLEDYNWAVVEANIQPGCRAYQAATKTGIRDEFLDIFKNFENASGQKNRHVVSVAQKMNVSYNKALEIMKDAEEKYGFSFAYYDNNNLHHLNELRLQKRAEVHAESVAQTDSHYASLLEKAGMTREDVDEFINKVKVNVGYAIPVRVIDEFELYKLPEKELYHKAMLLKEEQKLFKSIKKKLEQIDSGKATFEELEEKFERLHVLVKDSIGGSVQEKLEEDIKEAMPDRVFEGDELLELVTDMHITKALMGFSSMEYQNYHLEGKTFEQKFSFLSNTVRVAGIRSVNNKKFAEICDNKYLSYDLIPEAFGRKVILVESEKDFDLFEEYCKDHEKFVKKPLAASFGDGVELVKVADFDSLRDVFDYLLKTPGGVVLEGLIIQNEKTALFNKDSVNTVRIITCNFDDHIEVIGSFFRTGRNGTFVDNAGAGGVFAIPDLKTGIIFSDGLDEFGMTFKTHPDTGVAYKGYQIPAWDLLTETAKKYSKMIPEMKFIGWDFAYNDRGEWVVVEYNSQPEFIQQAAMETGMRVEFLEIMEELKKIKKERQAKKKEEARLQKEAEKQRKAAEARKPVARIKRLIKRILKKFL